ncbi:MAG: response regulator transcription factor [Candidatus Latescibacterota bacterium]|nr:MAG: response regulator transcription factor [Candidatus Latescibacterota bacterium]
MSTHTVFVVDDESSVRKSLERLLRAAGYHVESFASADEFLRGEPEERIGCLVLDVKMPDLDGLELQQVLAEADRCLPIVFITGHGDIPTSVRAMKAGAVDFLAKPFDADDLLAAIERALEAAGNQASKRAERAEIERRLAALTPREQEVLRHVITGQLNKQIAADLGTSEKTIKVHRGRAMRKMQVQSVAELVRLCEKVGIHGP